METKKFKTETKDLLNLMIHSIYTHKEIFLRELISNASDAIDKLKYLALQNPDLIKNSDFEITIERDEKARTLTINDNGIGMNKDDLMSNIGIIAKSGTKGFFQNLEKDKKMKKIDAEDFIGQFGVGFYSAFMVSEKIEILTKKVGEQKGYKWESVGDDSYKLDEAEKENYGTTIILSLRKNNDELEEIYDNYLNEDSIEELIKKYSDYIRYPIKMAFEEPVYKKDKDGKDTDKIETQEIVIKTLNSMIPIWKKDKNDITQEEYFDFYKSKFHDWSPPLEVIHYKIEGNIDYTALLFIPSKAPFDLHTADYKKGLSLYSKNVFIMQNCEDLLFDHFNFVKGVIDSSSFSLNISREFLQHSRDIKIIKNNVEKKIISTLKDLLKSDREKYETFFKEFGTILKNGLYSDYIGEKKLKEKLEDLILFESSKTDKYSTFDEYVSRMKADQKFIYYASGDSKDIINSLPQMEMIREKEIEILYLTEKVDEFCLESIRNYKEKEFKSITKGEIELADAETKKEKEKLEKNNKPLLEKIKDILKDKVKDVKLSNRLKESPVCLVSAEFGMSLEMEKIMRQMPNANQNLKADKILEINPDHDIFTTIKTMDDNKQDITAFSKLLYYQALLTEGMKIEDPNEFSKEITGLMLKK